MKKTMLAAAFTVLVLALAACGSSNSSGSTAPLSITTAATANATVGAAYSLTLTATGGAAPYTWAASSSSPLPAGISLNGSTGILSGTPTAAGSSTTSLTVTDSSKPAKTATLSFTLTVAAPAFTISAPAVLNGVIGVAYSQALAVTGGTAPLTWALSGGTTLPPGLALNASTGVISGTPTALGTYPVSATATDSATPPLSASVSFTLTITPPPVAISTATLPSGTVGTVYSQTLTATGGTPPYTWSVASGSLPPGLTLGAGSGILGGTPNAAGTTHFTVLVTDASSTTATAQLSFTAAPAALTGNALLQGQYFFKLDVFGDDATADSYVDHEAYIGSLTFDGGGNVSGGSYDYANDNEQSVNGSVTGTYTVGSDGRGAITLNGLNTNVYSFALAVGVAPQGSVASRARLVETDAAASAANYGPSYATGFLQLQDPTAFVPASLIGSSVFGFSGSTEILSQVYSLPQQGGLSLAGRLVVGSDTYLTADSTADIATNQVTDNNVPLTGSLTADTTPVGGSTAFATYGRAQLNLTSMSYANGFLPASSVVYVIDANTSYVISVPQGAHDPFYSGSLVRQSGSFSNASLSGSAIAYGSGQAVGALADYSSTNSVTLYDTSDAVLIQYVADGAGNITSLSDINSAGTIVNSVPATGIYSVAASGRVTFNTPGLPVFWLSAGNAGFGTSQPTGSGPSWPMLLTIEPQTAMTYSNASLSGTYLAGDQQLASFNTALFSGELSGDGAGDVTGTVDFFTDNAAQYFGSNALADVSTATVAANGRFTLATNYTLNGSAAGPTDTLVFYLVAPNRAVGIDTTASDTSPAIVVLEKTP